jgi:hypothetical protein
MKKILYLYFCISVLGFPIPVTGQTDSNQVNKIPKGEYCNPSIVGPGPAKGFTVLYERAGNSEITSNSRDTSVGNASAQIQRNNRFYADLKIPILNKPNLKLIGGFRYFYEEFDFKTNSDFASYPMYQNIESRHLKSIGTNINIIKSINATRYWVSRLMADLNGDYTNKKFPRSSFLKVSFAFLYGTKKCETKTTAIGFYLNYALGRQSIFPVFLYNNTFSKHWGIEALAPAYVKGRYNFSDKEMLYLGYELEGASYNLFINNPEIEKYTSLQLRRSTIRYELQYERELYKFLWMGLAVGLRQTLTFNVTTKGDKPGSISFQNGFHIVNGEPLIRNTLSPAPFINVSLYIVVPKDMLTKVIYSDEKDE